MEEGDDIPMIALTCVVLRYSLLSNACTLVQLAGESDLPARRSHRRKRRYRGVAFRPSISLDWGSVVMLAASNEPCGL